jgi:ATP-dependent Clp protease protease subunit
LKDDLNQILSYHTGQSIENIERDTNRDYYMGAKDAVEYGLVDQVMDIPESKLIKPESNEEK